MHYGTSYYPDACRRNDCLAPCQPRTWGGLPRQNSRSAHGDRFFVIETFTQISWNKQPLFPLL